MDNSSDKSLKDNSIYRWVKASERKPDKDGDYIVKATLYHFGDHIMVGLMRFTNGYWNEGDSKTVDSWLEKVEADQQELWGQLSETWKELTDHDMSKRNHSFGILQSKYTIIPKQ